MQTLANCFATHSDKLLLYFLIDSSNFGIHTDEEIEALIAGFDTLPQARQAFLSDLLDEQSDELSSRIAG